LLRNLKNLEAQRNWCHSRRSVVRRIAHRGELSRSTRPVAASLFGTCDGRAGDLYGWNGGQRSASLDYVFDASRSRRYVDLLDSHIYRFHFNWNVHNRDCSWQTCAYRKSLQWNRWRPNGFQLGQRLALLPTRSHSSCLRMACRPRLCRVFPYTLSRFQAFVFAALLQPHTSFFENRLRYWKLDADQQSNYSLPAELRPIGDCKSSRSSESSFKSFQPRIPAVMYLQNSSKNSLQYLFKVMGKIHTVNIFERALYVQFKIIYLPLTKSP